MNGKSSSEPGYSIGMVTRHAYPPAILEYITRPFFLLMQRTDDAALFDITMNEQAKANISSNSRN